MGLFDGFYDPQTYDSSNGLISRLLSQLGTQNQYQPGAGFPQSSMDAQAAMPVQQNAPIAVGNYQMPRIGAGFAPPQIDPQTGENVAPAPVATQPQQPAAAPQQPAQNPLAAFLQPQQSPGGFGAGMRGALANMQAGPLGMIAGGIAGAMGMGQGTAQDQKRRQMLAQYQALVPVLGPQKAMIAVINPDVGKALLSEALSNKEKFTKIGQDGLGGAQYGFVDETNQTVNGKPISQLPQSDANSGLGNMKLTGQDYLTSLPQNVRGTVQGMIEGTIPSPTSFALSKPYWQNMIAAAKNADPTFDAANWSGRIAGMRDFSSGKSADAARSANQALAHIGSLMDSATALNNGSSPLLNYGENKVEEFFGGGRQGAFRTNANAVADEVAKFFKGSNLSDHEVQEWKNNLSENMSPAQQRAQIGKLSELMQGGLEALEEKRQNSIGPIAAAKQGPLIKPAGQAVLRRISAFVNGGNAAGAPATTKTGVQWSVVQ